MRSPRSRSISVATNEGVDAGWSEWHRLRKARELVRLAAGKAECASARLRAEASYVDVVNEDDEASSSKPRLAT